MKAEKALLVAASGPTNFLKLAVGAPSPMRCLLPLLLLVVVCFTSIATAALKRVVPRTPDEATRQQLFGRVHESIRQRKLLKPTPPPAIPGDQLPNLVSSKFGRAAADPHAAVVAGTWLVRLAVPSAAAALAPPTGSRAAVAAVVADPSTDRRGRNVTAARAHVQAVEASIAEVASIAGIDSKITHRYAYAMSGFAVKGLTLAELQALRADPQVLSVTPNGRVRGATYSSPWFLGLTSPKGEAPGGPVQHDSDSAAANKGVWDKLGGVVGPDGAGEDIIIGVLDNGIWMEDHPSFADEAHWPSANNLGGQYYAPPPKGWKGTCQADADGTPYPCNNKVIGCRYFPDGYIAVEGELPSIEKKSCRDVNGHGTHVSSTAGANYGVQAPYTPAGALLSGAAPRARLAVYKVLWDNFGFDSDILLAIDYAIQDGVDILSASLGATYTWDSFADPVQIGYLNAAKAGVFVSVSAMNEGPSLFTVANNGPWLTSVAASTLPRKVSTAVRLGNGVTLAGVGWLEASLGPAPLVYGGDAAEVNATAASAKQCLANSLDPAKVQGKIVACDRGPTSRFAKAEVVVEAGGVGMVLLNTLASQNLVTAIYAVPTVHITSVDRATLLNYTSAGGSPTATLVGPSVVTYDQVAPEMAPFSSRGPCPAANGAVMKPDVTGPGVDIFAAYTRYNPLPDGYNYLSGTSMACPHVSGLAALLKDVHPHWDPMTIKSAIMTTAYTHSTAGNVFGTPLDFGSGHIYPAEAFNPGLVITPTSKDFDTLLCASTPSLKHPACQTLCPSSRPTGQASQVEARQLLTGKPAELQRHRGYSKPADQDCYRQTDQDYRKHTGDRKNQHTAGGGYYRHTDEGYDTHPDLPYGDDSSQGEDSYLVASTCPWDKVSFDINSPSISGNVGDTLVVQRTLRSVCAEEGPVRFRAVVSTAAAEGNFTISVSPESVSVLEGKSVTVTITIKANARTPLNKYQFGQVVWLSNKGHAVRIPVSVNFRAVLAPEVLAPVPTVPDFRYDFGIRTAGPGSINVYSTGLEPAQVEEVAMNEDDFGEFFFEVTSPIPYFAAATFFGDQSAIINLYLYSADASEDDDPIAEYNRRGYQFTTLLEAHNLPVGRYVIILEVDYSYGQANFTALLHLWDLAFQDPQNANGLMTVSPFRTVPVGPAGAAALHLACRHIDVPAPDEWPPTRYLGLLGYSRGDSGDVYDTTRVELFYPMVVPDF